MRNILVAAAASFVFGLASCAPQTPAGGPAATPAGKSVEKPADKPMEEDLKQVSQCHAYLRGETTDLRGENLAKAVAVLRHCLSVSGKERRPEIHNHLPEYSFTFKSTNSGAPRTLYGLHCYGGGPRLVWLTPEDMTFYADAATEQMIKDLIETAKRQIEKEAAGVGGKSEN
jgi:hypothetical protein